MKNKSGREIFIDLTALLDVILIMLFWVMMNTSQKAEDEKEKAASAQIQLEKEQQENKEKLSQAQKELEEQKQKAKDINEMAAANQQALDDYQKGLGLVVNIKFEGSSDNCYFFKGEEQILKANMDKEDTEESLKKAFDLMGYKNEDVILCTVTYDGENVLDRDYDKICGAAEKLRESYTHLYCTFINISEG